MSNVTVDPEKSEISSTGPAEGKGEDADEKLNVAKQISNGSADRGDPLTMSANLPKKSFKFKLTVFMLCLNSVVVAMDSVIVAATLPAITVALKGKSLEAFWVGTSYLLSQTVGVRTF
jgi:hypothetical protein